MLLDIHTHRSAPYPEGVISLMNCDSHFVAGQLYSMGLHPWNTTSYQDDDTFKHLEELAAQKQVVAIGECGVDLLKGGPIFRQLIILKKHVEISERLGKPLILHCVKSADILMGLRRDLNPIQPWIIHGFRGKPALASQLLDKGFFLSFGEHFNVETVKMMNLERILAETDESILSIEEIIRNLSEAADRDLTPVIASNISMLLC